MGWNIFVVWTVKINGCCNHGKWLNVDMEIECIMCTCHVTVKFIIINPWIALLIWLPLQSVLTMVIVITVYILSRVNNMIIYSW